MRAALLFGLTLAILAVHLVAWRLAVSGPARFATPHAGAARRVLAAMSRSVAPPARMPRSQPTPMAPIRARASALRDAVAARAALHTAATGTGGSARGRPANAPAWRVYPTQPPPSATLRYRLVQLNGRASDGASGPSISDGSAELDWVRDSDAFSLRLATTLPGHFPREWRSAGVFDAAGAAPVRLVEREKGRDRRAVDFDRVAGRVRFSGAAPSLPLAPGAQDRWSWIAQLAAIAEAAAGSRQGIVTGTTWRLPVAGMRGDLDGWTFRVLPDEALPPESRPRRNDVSSAEPWASPLLHVLREPERPYDLRIEAWLSPSLHHLPRALRMSTPPSGWSMTLWPADADGGT